MSSKKEIEKLIYELNKLFSEKSLNSIIKSYNKKLPQNNWIILNEKDKGIVGKIIEKCIFKIDNNNSKEADLNGEWEIKVIGLKENKNGIMVAKERLVFSIINYGEMINEKNLIDSHFFKKCKKMILCFYEYKANEKIKNFRIKMITLFDLEKFNFFDEMKKDYQIIYKKVINGNAEKISGADTNVIEAIVKGENSKKALCKQPYSDVKAKRRAFALKNRHVTYIYNWLQTKIDKVDVLSCDVDEVISKLNEFKNQSINDLRNKFKITSLSKSSRFTIILAILNVKSLNEITCFMDGNLIIKTICLEQNFKLKEHIPLCQISINEMNDKTDFYESQFYNHLKQKIIFVVFKKSDNDLFLIDSFLFEFSELEINNAKYVYENTISIFNSKKPVETNQGKNKYFFIKASDNKTFHIRPKAINSSDKYSIATKYGFYLTKQAFWFNKDNFLNRLKKMKNNK